MAPHSLPLVNGSGMEREVGCGEPELGSTRTQGSRTRVWLLPLTHVTRIMIASVLLSSLLLSFSLPLSLFLSFSLLSLTSMVQLQLSLYVLRQVLH